MLLLMVWVSMMTRSLAGCLCLRAGESLPRRLCASCSHEWLPLTSDSRHDLVVRVQTRGLSRGRTCFAHVLVAGEVGQPQRHLLAGAGGRTAVDAELKTGANLGAYETQLRIAPLLQDSSGSGSG